MMTIIITAQNDIDSHTWKPVVPQLQEFLRFIELLC